MEITRFMLTLPRLNDGAGRIMSKSPCHTFYYTPYNRPHGFLLVETHSNRSRVNKSLAI